MSIAKHEIVVTLNLDDIDNEAWTARVTVDSEPGKVRTYTDDTTLRQWIQHEVETALWRFTN